MSTKVHFIAPEIQENPEGWGPCAISDQFKDMPYQPFSKSDRVGKVADWTGQTYADKRMANKYNSQFAGGAQYSFFIEEDDDKYQLVDTGRGTRSNQRGPGGRLGGRIGQRNQRNRLQGGRGGGNMQVINKNGRMQPGRGGMNQNTRGGRWSKNQSGRGKYDKQGGMKKRDALASVYVKSSWKVLEEMDFPRLSKLTLPGISEGSDIYKCGSLEYYDKTYDRVTCKNEKRLQRVNRISYKVTTTDDPMIRTLSKSHGNVYATDAIIAALMCATRSVISWDIVVQRVGDKLFFDKRDESDFDLLTVNETAADPPYNDEEGKNTINWPKNLAMEATYISHNFSQQALKKEEQRFSFENPNPFIREGDESEPLSVAYRYRKFDLGDGIELVVRTELDAVTVGPSGDHQFMNLKGLLEWDSKVILINLTN